MELTIFRPLLVGVFESMLERAGGSLQELKTLQERKTEQSQQNVSRPKVMTTTHVLAPALPLQQRHQHPRAEALYALARIVLPF